MVSSEVDINHWNWLGLLSSSFLLSCTFLKLQLNCENIVLYTEIMIIFQFLAVLHEMVTSLKSLPVQCTFSRR